MQYIFDNLDILAGRSVDLITDMVVPRSHFSRGSNHGAMTKSEPIVLAKYMMLLDIAHFKP
jgi:hypothetical protein